MLIDSHAHLNFKAFDKDWQEAVQRSLDDDIWMVNIGSQFATTCKAIEMAQQYPEGVYASAGFHPIHVKGKKIQDEDEGEGWEEFNKEKLLELAKEEAVVCVGETGLDYYRVEDFENKEKQAEIFKEHCQIAQEINKPLMVHCRDISVSNEDYPKLEKNQAYKDILNILKDYPDLVGAIHCFGGSLEIAQEFIKKGFYIGFTGVITFKKKAEELQEVVKSLPLENILVETDCPYLSPEPYRGKRSEPLYVKYVAQKIAELKNISFEEVANQTTQNARQLFKI